MHSQQRFFFNDDQVISFIDRHNAGETLGDIARELGMTSTNLAYIIEGYRCKEFQDKTKIPSEKKSEVLELFRSGMLIRDISKQLNIRKTHISWILKSHGLKQSIKKPLLESNLGKFLEMYYAGESMRTIALAIGCRESYLYAYIEKNGLEKREPLCPSYELNECALDSISDEGAYWIGFLMADGWICKNVIQIQLKCDDVEHLHRFNKFFGTNRPIIHREGKISNYKGSEIKSGDQVGSKFSSEKLVKILNSYGVTERKSHSADIHGLESNRNFWRGCIDGDGSMGIYLPKRKNPKPRPKIMLIGSVSIIDKFKTYCNSIGLGLDCRVCKVGKSFTYTLCGPQCCSLVKDLWRPGDQCLERKRQIAMQIIEQFG